MSCKSYTDVVFSPVDGADGHTQATQAALVHGAGDGAAHARVAPQSKAAWGGGKLWMKTFYSLHANAVFTLVYILMFKKR